LSREDTFDKTGCLIRSGINADRYEGFVPACMPGVQMMPIPGSRNFNEGYPLVRDPEEVIQLLRPELFFAWAQNTNGMYVPAMLEHIFKPPRKYEGSGLDNRYSMSWWDHEGFFFHPSLLVSAYYGCVFPDFRKEFRVADDVLFIGDSGGFQVATKLRTLELELQKKTRPKDKVRLEDKIIALKKKFDPAKVYEWQERNCNIALTLDVPAFDIMSRSGVSEAEFRRALDETVSNNEYYAANRGITGGSVRVFNVIHGSSVPRIREWYEAVEAFPFEGWSIAPKPSRDPIMLSFMLSFLYCNGIRSDVHVLGMSGRNTMPIIVYASQFIERVTYDSSSYGTGATRRLYQLPIDPAIQIQFGEVYEGGLEKLPCNCPVCQNVQIEDLNSEDYLGGALISLHNLWTMLERDLLLRRIAKHQETFSEYSRKNLSPRAQRALEIFDRCVKKPTLEAWEQEWTRARGLLDLVNCDHQISQDALFEVEED